MSAKREYEDASDSDGEIPNPAPKRVKKQPTKARQHQSSDFDATWGQKFVFSSSENATTIPFGEEDDFEDDSDAMAYLMSVRQEAGDIPHLLVAPKPKIGPQMPAGYRKRLRPPNNDADEGEVTDEDDEDDPVDRSIYTEGIPDPRGYYEDGAYVAKALETEDQASDEETSEAAQKALHNAYFTSVLDQYLNLRAILHSTPPPDAAERLSSSHPTHAGGRGYMSIWSRLLRTTDPHPVQLALMPKASVLLIIRVLLGGKFLCPGHELPERTSRWLWALIARLPEYGELTYSEISCVRDLGCRAALLGASPAQVAALHEVFSPAVLGFNAYLGGSKRDDGVEAGAVGEPANAEESSGKQPTEYDGNNDEDVEADAMVEPADAQESSDKQPNGPLASSTHGQDQHDTKDGEEGEVEEDVNMDEQPADPEPPTHNQDQPDTNDAEEGEVEEDVPMDIESGSEEGEASDNEQTLEDVKARLLAQLDEEPASDGESAEDDAQTRARINKHATINMILTVAGGLYGQRDLLEHRKPFVGI